MKDFELLEHTADIKIRVCATTMQQLFEHALVAMFQIIRPKAKDCLYVNERIVCSALPVTRTIQLTSIDYSYLLIDFLSEALYLSDYHHEAYLAVNVSALSSTAITAQISGVVIDGLDGPEIKAVTYHDVHLIQKKDFFSIDIVFDI